MNTSPPPTPASPKRPHGPLFYLQHVIIAALIIATLFTAWTRADLLPQTLTDKIAGALAAREPAETAVPNAPTGNAPSKLRIGIVAGHWGNDSGAVCDNGVREVDVNLEVATLVAESLDGLGYEVDLLQEFDPRLEGYRAAVLLSIHADSCVYVNDEATGYKVAPALSTRYPEQTDRLIACMRDRYEKATSLPFHRNTVTDDMTYYHAFEEIDNNTAAAIIEIGFLNLDYNILTEQPELISTGVTNGILCYVQNEDVDGEDEAPVSPTSQP